MVKLGLKVALLLLVLLISAQCQQTAEEWYNQGNKLLDDQGEEADAVKAYDEAIIRFDPDNPHLTVAWYKKGKAYTSQGDWENALDAYDNATELAPNNSEAWNSKGETLVALGKNEEAVEAYGEVTRLDPNNTYAWIAKGVMLDLLNRYDEAIKCYDEAIRLDPNNTRAWAYKADSLNKTGKLVEAAKVDDEAVRLRHIHATDWYNKGRLHDSLGEISAAINDYHQAVLIEPTFAEAWYNMGKGLYANSGKMNTYDQSMKCFTKAAELDPKLDIWQTGEIWGLLKVETQSDWEYWKQVHAI